MRKKHAVKSISFVMILVAMTIGGLVGSSTSKADSGSANIIPSPNSSPTADNELESVDCVTESFCMAVGSFSVGSTEQTLVLRWSDDEWTAIPSPNNSVTQDNLKSVSCVSESFCTAVGFFEGGSGPEALAMSWDGSTWTLDPTLIAAPTAYSVLNAVSCVSATFCLAVGSIGASPMQTLILQWDGTTWAQVPSPNTSPSLANSLQGVSCLSPSRCTAVGFHSDGISNLTLALHWDDTSWVQIPTPNPWRGSTPSQNNSLRSISCTSSTACVAVGSYGYLSAGLSLVLTWDGDQWTQVGSPEPAAYRSPLLSVACVTGNACAAVGSFKEFGVESSQPCVVWSGGVWEQQSAPTAGVALNELTGVSCLSASECIGVGYYLSGSVRQTLIMSLSRPDPKAAPVFTG